MASLPFAFACHTNKVWREPQLQSSTKLSPSSVYSYLLLFTLSFFFCLPPAAADRSKSMPIYEKLGRQITVLPFGAPDDFSKHLRELDAESSALSIVVSPENPWTADVWVFFLEKPAQLLDFPPFIQHVFLKSYSGVPEVTASYSQFILNNKDTHGAAFGYLWHPNTQRQGMGCLAAASVYQDVTGLIDAAELSELAKECEEGR